VTHYQHHSHSAEEDPVPTISYSQQLTLCFYIQALDFNPGHTRTVFLDPATKAFKEYFEKAVTMFFGIHESSSYIRSNNMYHTE
jgi:hypothetical protein